MDRGERPIARRPDLHGHHRARGVAGAEVLLVTVQHQLHGSARLLGQLAGHDRKRGSRGGRRELAAEAPAHVLGDHVDVLAVDAERLGHAIAHGEHSLRGGPDRELIAVPLGDDAVRLERRMRVRRDGIGLLDRDRRVGEALLDVATAAPAPGRLRPQHVSLARNVLRTGDLVRLVDEGSIVRHRLLEIGDEGRLVVGDLDEARGVVRHLGRDGRHRRDVLAREAHGAALARPHRLHTRQRLRFRGVDLRDLAGGHRRADHLAPQHPGHVDVEGVLGPSGDLVLAVQAWLPALDDA